MRVQRMHTDVQPVPNVRGAVTATLTAAVILAVGAGPGSPAAASAQAQAATGSAAMTAEGSGIPSGTYELEATLGGRGFPARLDLVAIGGRPWGRMTVVAGRAQVFAVRGIGATGEAWDFVAGGPVRSMRVRFADSVVVGTLVLGDGPPVHLEGRRTGELATSDAEGLLAQHALEPLGFAVRTGAVGASFPTGTPDGGLIFARHGANLSHQTLMASTAADHGWRDPRVMPLSGRHSDRSPAVAPDGSALVFASDRPAAADDDFDGYRLWVAPRLDSGEWGEPVPVQFEGGWDHDARQPSITADGTLYFSSAAPGGHGEGDIYRADRVAPGRWTAPRNLGEPVNGPGDEHGAFVAPDGSYMVLASAGARPGRAGGDDLYVSRRTSTGWSSPVALELPVNTFANEYGAWVSPVDGQLYFTSDRYGGADIFRVEGPRGRP